ncbi:hypothetical protein [Mesorhizobium sp. B2-4-6]|uniref:hypothetical protein n=1 Tax=Mesorhizobium sp. B2-4-6 TaxID=2589943 RepID=UPI00112A9205|nr:hypothetical protein [Mesorhizobium sp. B2-4-6]TPL42298.1 hypothetical protein FJ957_24665 [Mesorhizobium sp. B2-4-6]
MQDPRGAPRLENEFSKRSGDKRKILPELSKTKARGVQGIPEFPDPRRIGDFCRNIVDHTIAKRRQPLYGLGERARRGKRIGEAASGWLHGSGRNLENCEASI